MSDVYEIVIQRLMPKNTDAATAHLVEKLVRAAIDVTHETGTVEGTVDAVLNTCAAAIFEMHAMVLGRGLVA